MSPENTHHTPGQGETVEQWRARATSMAILAVAAMDIPLTVVAIWLAPNLAQRTFFAVSCAVVVALAFCRRLNPQFRTGVMSLVAYATGVMMFMRAGLAGSGRLVLFATPLYVLVLMERRYGVLALATSVAIFAALTVLVGVGWVLPSGDMDSVATWTFQGVTLSLLAAALFLLIDRSRTFLIKTLDQEQALARELAGELEENKRMAAVIEAEIASRRQLERRLLDVGEGERTAVGQELHDGVCQQLSAAYLGARLLERDLAAVHSSVTVQAAELAGLLESAQNDARLLARGLNPGPLPVGGLPDALRELARQVRDRVEIDCDVVRAEAPSLTPLAATQLLRIAQEATANAIRHAHASSISIDLSEDDTGIHLIIRDDGRGIQPGVPGGLGLRSMANRAQGLGGALTITSRINGGTEVVCALPHQSCGGTP